MRRLIWLLCIGLVLLNDLSGVGEQLVAGEPVAGEPVADEPVAGEPAPAGLEMTESGSNGVANATTPVAQPGQEPAQPPADPAAPAASGEQIAAWVRDLGDPQYVVRDAATRELIAAGAVSIGPVGAALSGSGLEVTTRGIFVLQQLALADDRSTEQAARAAIERVARLRITAAARRAQEALTKLDEQRQVRAVSQLQRLGVRFDEHHVEMGLPVANVHMVEIGDAFRGNDSDLLKLADLRQIDQVSFVGSKVDKAWIRHVAAMPHVSIVKIKRVAIDNATLAHLKAVPNLTYLKLLYVPVDKGSIEHLQQCRKLSKLMLFGTQIKRDEADSLKQQLASEIDHRNGAFLGISPQPGQPCIINNVTPESAADRAGLRPGDIITRFQGHEINSFEELTTRISQINAGDTIKVEIIRGTTRQELPVTLGEWD